MKELNKKVNSCIKARGADKILKQMTGFKLADWGDSELDSAREAFGEVRNCIFESLRQISNDEFALWMKQEAQPLRAEADEIGRRMIRYWGRMNDPYEIVINLSIFSQILSEFWSDSNNEAWDPDIAPKLLMTLQVNLLRNTIEKAKLRLLNDVLSLANSTLELDTNWCASALVSVLEELIIKRKLGDLGVELEDNEKFHSLCRKLESAIKKSGERLGLDILLSSGHRKARNNILHEGWMPSDEDTERIITHVMKLSQDLGLKPTSAAKD